MNNNIFISIIIIGYNSKIQLSSLLRSINKQSVSSQNIEVVYVDDGSNDDSFDFFLTYNLIFKKIGFKNSSNLGRCVARAKGIELSLGRWCLFLNSSVTIDKHLIKEYLLAIKNNPGADAFKGRVVYKSKDLMFEKYLNNSLRGMNNYKQYEQIHFKHFLFDSCIIKKTLFSSISLNQSLTGYGGWELDVAYKIAQNDFLVLSCLTALSVRNNHPSFKKHCLRLFEYGNYNLSLLSPPAQKEVVQSRLFLIKTPGAFFMLDLFSWCVFKLYVCAVPFNKNFVIKAGLFLSILKGYHRSK